MTRVAILAIASLAMVGLGGAAEPFTGTSAGGSTEVVALLASPPLAYAPGATAEIADEQRVFRHELRTALPEARIGWRYRLVANGFSVTLPSAELPRLRALRGVREVLASAAYVPSADAAPGLDAPPPPTGTPQQQMGAPTLWGANLETAGQGVKIGIIDSGVDPSHPFFDPTGYSMPPGFPKGQVRYTSAKIIVARVFPPKGATASSTRVAFSGSDSGHGTHVAGIAAGDPNTPAGDGRVLSGVAPRAYIGNYKVFVETSSGESPNANSPAIVAAIEAAVADGMDVVNFSGGEPEIDPRRDIVARALDAAAAAGVVPVIAAGNDYREAGAGSVSSPANAQGAIAVGAAAVRGTPPRRVHASFSSVGPTAMSLRLKPDVAAPGVDVLSSVPDGWAFASGTSMASPHVAGAAALLRQRHPGWTVEQVKSALVQSGSDVVGGGDRPLGPRFQGGGFVALPRADHPLLFAEPTALSFGLLRRGDTETTGAITLADAGGGAGTWRVALVTRDAPAGARLVLPTTVQVPGELDVGVDVSPTAALGDLDGYIELRHGADVRRVPFWGRVAANRLARHVPVDLSRPGTYHGTTAGQPALVSRYRYPESPGGLGVATTVLRGPERVYRVRIAKRVANFGVVVTQRAPGSRVEPRVVVGADENRLTGYAGLPLDYNPYLDSFRTSALAAGALLPAPGEYSIVFDSGARAGAGSFTFRYWVDDVTPPTLRLRARTVAAGRPVQVAASDAGAGVYPASVAAEIDGSDVPAVFRRGVISVPTSGILPGRHRLRVRVSDYQEAKNTENTLRILPNTRTLTATIRVR